MNEPIGGNPMGSYFTMGLSGLKAWWLRMGYPSDDMLPNEATAKTAIIFVGCLGLCEFFTCALIVFGADPLSRGAPWAVILLLIFLVMVAGCMLVILRQPQNK